MQSSTEQKEVAAILEKEGISPAFFLSLLGDFNEALDGKGGLVAAWELNWFQCQGQFPDSYINENENPYLYSNKTKTQHGRRICADHAVFIGRISLILINMLQ